MKGQELGVTHPPALPDMGVLQAGQAVRFHEIKGQPVALHLEGVVVAIGAGAEIVGVDKGCSGHGILG